MLSRTPTLGFPSFRSPTVSSRRLAWLMDLWCAKGENKTSTYRTARFCGYHPSPLPCSLLQQSRFWCYSQLFWASASLLHFSSMGPEGPGRFG